MVARAVTVGDLVSLVLQQEQQVAMTFAGKVAIEEEGGPTIPYATERFDMENGHTSDPKDQLPNADMGYVPRTIQHIRTISGILWVLSLGKLERMESVCNILKFSSHRQNLLLFLLRPLLPPRY
jgi:hypothetical protein